MSKQNISASLSSDLVERLDELVTETERTRSWLISKALESYLEELEDIRIARERLHEERLSPSEIRKNLGL
jgi:predicted DNA-binding protein